LEALRVRDVRDVERMWRRGCQPSSGEVEAEVEVELCGGSSSCTRETLENVKDVKLECDLERRVWMKGAETLECEISSDVSAKKGVQVVGNMLEDF
jgi:hypothetical protein